jgi:hypothetical protein
MHIGRSRDAVSRALAQPWSMRPQILFPLFAPLSSLPGMGPKLAPLMARAVGGDKVADLIWHKPAALVDRRATPPIATAAEIRSYMGEVIEEKVSLSDRFGLWIGFHNCSQDDYLAMIFGYVAHYELSAPPETIRAEALEWSITRGARSGRVAWQYICDLAGRLGKTL